MVAQRGAEHRGRELGGRDLGGVDHAREEVGRLVEDAWLGRSELGVGAVTKLHDPHVELTGALGHRQLLEPLGRVEEAALPHQLVDFCGAGLELRRTDANIVHPGHGSSRRRASETVAPVEGPVRGR